ncbi:aldo/keto reductase [Nocardia jiangxiensis]|uniref:aldo/keto reductase n=1 Tax=Nocardia jiangxiensis TaxID=282685 RepID=UPI0002F75407|nr:aldo/keto reductase [Nocardia jiangxiensis]
MLSNRYSLLGRSGLRVSPFCLGAMTFGSTNKFNAGAWGTDEETARKLFDLYVDAGGNFVDTAVTYMTGQSEELVGAFIRDRGLRDRIVIGTKFTPSTDEHNPNASGNGRKNIHSAVETSLRRLGADYIDLYWMHFWDMVTPADEVVGTLDGLVKSGKILHYGLSNVPAWYLAQAHAIATRSGKERPIALQMEYSLVSRYIEREHIPATQELGVGVCTWSPLGSGFLSGKYKSLDTARTADHGTEEVSKGRLDTMSGSPLFDRNKERNWRILQTLHEVAAEMGTPPAQVALAWLAGRPGVTSIILGATRVEQFVQNLGAAALAIPAELRQRLDSASAIDIVSPHEFFVEPHKSMLRGKFDLAPWRPS